MAHIYFGWNCYFSSLLKVLGQLEEHFSRVHMNILVTSHTIHSRHFLSQHTFDMALGIYFPTLIPASLLVLWLNTRLNPYVGMPLVFIWCQCFFLCANLFVMLSQQLPGKLLLMCHIIFACMLVFLSYQHMSVLWNHPPFTPSEKLNMQGPLLVSGTRT